MYHYRVQRHATRNKKSHVLILETPKLGVFLADDYAAALALVVTGGKTETEAAEKC